MYGFVNNNPLSFIDALGLEITVDPNDVKHPKGSCSDNYTCRMNMLLTRGLLAATTRRLANDFTKEFYDKAVSGEAFPPGYKYPNANVKYFRTSWNNHIKALKQDVGRLTDCVAIVAKQFKDG